MRLGYIYNTRKVRDDDEEDKEEDEDEKKEKLILMSEIAKLYLYRNG